MADQVFCKDCKYCGIHYPEPSLSWCKHKSATVEYKSVTGSEYYGGLCKYKNIDLNCEHFEKRESLWQKIRKYLTSPSV